MQNQQNKTELNEQTNDKIVIVSVGHHTRLGDILEYAVAGIPFETVDADAFLQGDWTNRKLLFALSAEATGENTLMHLLTARLNEKTCSLEGCICAAIADGAQGGQIHLDTLSLLLAANQAGAAVLARPLLEGDRELRFFSGGKESPFERYRLQARLLVERLITRGTDAPEHPRIRFSTALEGGAAHDWGRAITSMVADFGGEIEDITVPDRTILLCENTDGLPSEKTLSLLSAQGHLCLILASPVTGSDLYTAAIVERACLRGNYMLPPRAVIVFDGKSAVEVLASKREMERVRRL